MASLLPLVPVIGTAADLLLRSLATEKADAGCSNNELDRLARNQDRTYDVLQGFYREQQEVNHVAVQEFRELQSRTGALEKQSKKSRKFMKKQRKINEQTAESLASLEERLDGGKKGRKKQKPVQCEESSSGDDDDNSDED